MQSGYSPHKGTLHLGHRGPSCNCTTAHRCHGRTQTFASFRQFAILHGLSALLGVVLRWGRRWGGGDNYVQVLLNTFNNNLVFAMCRICASNFAICADSTQVIRNRRCFARCRATLFLRVAFFMPVADGSAGNAVLTTASIASLPPVSLARLCGPFWRPSGNSLCWSRTSAT